MKNPLLFSTSVLQLNRLWQPLRYRSIEYALTKMFNTAKEEPLLPVWIEINENGTLGSGTRSMSIEEWMTLPIDESQPYIRMTPNRDTNQPRNMRVPLVVISPSFAGYPKVQLQLNKRGLYIRDKGHCAYCNKKISLDEATIDHVTPKDLGGQHTWENTVLSCSPCNNKKANKTPKQANMPLLVAPNRPKERAFFQGQSSHTRDEHRFFLHE